MIEPGVAELPVVRQCELLGVSRSSAYYEPVPVGPEELALMALIDRQYLATPFYGTRRMTAWLRTHGHAINRKRVRRLMQLMGLEAIYRRPRTSRPATDHRVYPYLLRDLAIERVNQVWAADITYIPMARGFLYLVAIMGLGQPLGGGLAAVQHARHRLLPRRSRGRAGTGSARHLQHRPRQPVHQPGLHRDARAPRHPHQHGRPRPLQRQYLRRATVAQRQVRGGLPARLRQRCRGPCRSRPLLPFLQ